MNDLLKLKSIQVAKQFLRKSVIFNVFIHLLQLLLITFLRLFKYIQCEEEVLDFLKICSAAKRNKQSQLGKYIQYFMYNINFRSYL